MTKLSQDKVEKGKNLLKDSANLIKVIAAYQGGWYKSDIKPAPDLEAVKNDCAISGYFWGRASGGSLSEFSDYFFSLYPELPLLFDDIMPVIQRKNASGRREETFTVFQWQDSEHFPAKGWMQKDWTFNFRKAADTENGRFEVVEHIGQSEEIYRTAEEIEKLKKHLGGFEIKLVSLLDFQEVFADECRDEIFALKAEEGETAFSDIGGEIPESEKLKAER